MALGVLDLLPARQLVRFLLTGGAATLTHFAVLSLAVEWFGVPASLANGLAFCVAVGVTYAGQSFWVFQTGHHDLRQIRRFLLSAIGGFVANVGLMALIVNGVGADYRIGFAVVVVVVPLATFLVNKFWVFTGPPAASAAPDAVQADRLAWTAGALLVACLGPLALTPLLPFTDFYAHIVRYHVLAHIGGDPALQAQYDAAWQLLPNLGLDLVGTAMMWLGSPLVMAKLLGAVTMLAPALGALALARVLHGRIGAVNLVLAGLIVFNNILFWGFANFLLGLGIALAGLALWIAQAGRPARQLITACILGMGLFFVHGLAFALWGLLLGMVELSLAARQAGGLHIPALARRAGRLLLIALLPALLFTQMPTSQAEGGVTVAFDNLARHAEAGQATARILDEIGQRLNTALLVVEAGLPWADRVLGTAVWLLLGAGIGTGLLRLDLRVAGAAALCAVLIVILPPNMFSVGYLDDRMPLVLLALLAAGLHVAPATAAGRARAGRALVAGLAGVFAVRTALIWGLWYQDGQMYRSYLAALDDTPTGQIAAPLFFDGTGHRRSQVTNCKPLLFAMLLRNGTAVPTFAFATQQPLRLDGALAAAQERLPRTDTAPPDSLTPLSERQTLLDRTVAAGFDTIIACSRTPATPAPDGLTLAAAAPHWAIYLRAPQNGVRP